IGIPPPSLRVTTNFGLSEIRPVEMHAADAGAVARRPGALNMKAGPQHRVDGFRRPGGRGREDCGGPVAGVAPVGRAHGVGRAIHVVGACPAMYVNVDEARRDQSFAGIHLYGIPWTPEITATSDFLDAAAMGYDDAVGYDGVRQDHMAVVEESGGRCSAKRPVTHG